ncbi:extracellular solute-binding protein [Anopheles sinensis]|uniref:Extracellular solute-binding protein n=1 Tax=Anopheles sinensis TaxID=74873 RepID=A0A084WQA4_ANOSI|nr:extracellular solute-binding protein [Anopheles sinensis]
MALSPAAAQSEAMSPGSLRVVSPEPGTLRDVRSSGTMKVQLLTMGPFIRWARDVRMASRGESHGHLGCGLSRLLLHFDARKERSS